MLMLIEFTKCTILTQYVSQILKNSRGIVLQPYEHLMLEDTLGKYTRSCRPSRQLWNY